MVFLAQGSFAVKVDTAVADGLGNDTVPVIISFQKYIPPDSVMASVGITSTKAASANSRPDLVIRKRYRNFNMIAGNISREGLKKLMENPSVKSIEMDARVSILLDKSAPLIGASEVNEMGYNGAFLRGNGASVCVIDTGVDSSHPALSVIGGYDFVNSDNDPMDDNGHGTMVAGIISSRDSRYTGVAPESGIVALKALDSAGSGSFSDVVASIDYCITNRDKFNISAISMSLGVSGFRTNDSSECDSLAAGNAINTAVQNNIPVVVSSGNGGYPDGISYPACASGAISVGATDDYDRIASFSNSASLLDLLAPGVGIKTSYPGTEFLSGSGTSFSAPHIAGAVALLRQMGMINSSLSLSPSEVENLLKNTGVRLIDGKNGLSFPRVDINAAVLSLAGNMNSQETPMAVSIESPKPIVYASRSIPLIISLTAKADSIEYSANGRFATLCSNCRYFKDNVVFSEGSNEIVVRANRKGVSNSTNVSFLVDSIKPKIHSTNSNGWSNGTFAVTFTEENPKNISLWIRGNGSNFSRFEMKNCASGRRVSCTTNIGISNMENQAIDFYFTIADLINEVSSRIQSSVVDTTRPSLIINSPIDGSAYYGRLTLDAISSEPAAISYSVNDGPQKKLCTYCRTVSRKQAFSTGNNSVAVYAADRAGNSNSRTVSFQTSNI